MKGKRRSKPAKRMDRRQVVRACVIIGAVSLFAIGVGMWTLVGILADSNRKIDALYLSATENRAKLVAVGEQPVGPPPSEIVGKQGPAGQNGSDGQDGSPGATGEPGRAGPPGRNATTAQVAAAVAAYMRKHPAKAGPAGPPGRDGASGADGQSPACLAEPDQCQGSQGPAGADGAVGAPPGAWAWTDPNSGVTYNCRRDEHSPDIAPAYSCTPA